MIHLSRAVLLAFFLASCRSMSISHNNPEGLMKSEAFTQVVEVEARRLLFISGQVALNKEGILVGNDLSTQFQQSLQNVGTALMAGGSDWQRVAQLRIYVVDLKPEHRFIIMMELDKIFGKSPRPANTLIGVQSLARRDLRVEIEAVAVAN